MAWSRRILAAFPAVLLLVSPGCFEPAANGWAVQAIQLDDLRAQGATGRAIRVAVLDSGIDLTHPSLGHLRDGRVSDGEVVAYVDFLGSSAGPQDRGGHGTFVAGVLAARPPEGLASVTAAASSVRGLAPNVELLVGRVCETDHCDLIALWKAIEWATEQDADIISLSLGYTSAELAKKPLIADRVTGALSAATAKGILVVAAAGNNQDGVLFPARLGSVLAVGAMDRDGDARLTSARGLGSRKPDLVAPGQDIVGPGQGGGRITVDGTSAAVPFVVAAAALLMEAVHDPVDSGEVAELRAALTGTAAPLPGQARPHDTRAGYGLVQADAAASRYAILLEAHHAEGGERPPFER